MREIKFRAWDGRKMIMPRVKHYYQHFLSFCGNIVQTCREGMQTFGGEDIWSIQHDLLLMQYTGLKDKNGVEIYEGDICEHLIGMDRDRAIEVNGSVNAFLNIIEWQSAAWGFRPVFPALCHEDDKEWRSFHVDPFEGEDWGSDDFEVIGNLHENPELLK